MLGRSPKMWAPLISLIAISFAASQENGIIPNQGLEVDRLEGMKTVKVSFANFEYFVIVQLRLDR